MKIIVATTQSQGMRENDFCFVTEGEIVYPSWTCTFGSDDDECGCRRCLTGVMSGKGTTTVTVIDSPMKRDEYQAIIESGIGRALGHSATDDDASLRKYVIDAAELMLVNAVRYSAGDVLEYRSGLFSRRIAVS